MNKFFILFILGLFLFQTSCQPDLSNTPTPLPEDIEQEDYLDANGCKVPHYSFDSSNKNDSILYAIGNYFIKSANALSRSYVINNHFLRSIHHKDLETAKCFLEKGEDVNVIDGNDGPAIRYAIQNGHLEGVKFLIENGADVNLKNKYGGTPLHLAVEKQYLDIISLLLENGADVDARDNSYNRTPLYNAVSLENLEIIKLLLKHGADPLAKNQGSGTPLDNAKRNNNKEIIKLLEEAVEKQKALPVK